MNTERKNTTAVPNEPPEEAWEVFLPEDEEPWPEEGDFWFDLSDMEHE